MTKLPAKALLDGSKLPKTTTGEMKDALGKLRDYLSDLLCEDSADREAARLALGIDLTGLGAQIGSKSDRTELETKVDRKDVETAISGLENRLQTLEEEIAKRGLPIGTVVMFTAPEAPAGYLKADGSAVGRETYSDLFAAIGTTYGEGDEETTFNLPDLMGRFAQGDAVPGTAKEAGLPNITGDMSNWGSIRSRAPQSTIGFQGAFHRSHTSGNVLSGNSGQIDEAYALGFNASYSNSIYGASATVQPPP